MCEKASGSVVLFYLFAQVTQPCVCQGADYWSVFTFCFPGLSFFSYDGIRAKPA